MLAEEQRLQEAHLRTANWQRWGPYLSERQWGTVREDYSDGVDTWNYFPHDHARSRAYRWGEDGLLGICDRECRLCFSLAVWNGRDPILKERLFGVTGPEGNHGEDVKEAYFYVDSTPTHSYLRGQYKYPQAEYPYARLVEESQRRSRCDPEFELADTGVFEDGRYFDIVAEYAKASPNDILIRITIANRGPEPAVLHLLPTLWFRNTWSWGCTHEGCEVKPRIEQIGDEAVVARHTSLGVMRLVAEADSAGELTRWLFTENETNSQRLFGHENSSPAVKDAFHDFVVQGQRDAVSSRRVGTKVAAYRVIELAPGVETTVRLRLTDETAASPRPFGPEFEQVFTARRREADEFYAAHIPASLTDAERQVSRQAYAGLLWSKQFYHYVVKNWIEGDPDQPPPPAERLHGRNHDWKHLFNRDVISMPDKWEYPWYAAWDLAFHTLPFAKIDPEFAKSQLILFLREWYMHPNGQLPAYEWAFSDVNPPVHAWACWRVYKMTGPRGGRDRVFLARVFHKLLLNFTWWINRKDWEGNNLFSGGFLGMDNVGVFDRSMKLPWDVQLEQADGTAWMAFFCATMLSMALELASEDPAYEDIASKFFEHFVAIANAMNTLGGSGLWDEQDGFYYDQLQIDGQTLPLRVKSMVGIVPLFAVEVLDDEVIQHLPGFRKRMEWFLKHCPELSRDISYMERETDGGVTGGHRLLAIPSRERLVRVLRYVLDEQHFLSPFGVRSLSQWHREHPYVLDSRGHRLTVDYVPGESTLSMFGGNSNWRGPIWFPMNYLLVEALERYHHFYGDDLKVECPTGSGKMLTLAEVAREISSRLVRLFVPDANGQRPCFTGEQYFATDPHWRDLLLFHEYFHGDTGRGLGASHQTGWTALITRLLEGRQ
ncbi:MAG: glucosidase [Planctomycetales bacterium]|nr:glucosidase [Planctomycetales bacterium]